MFYNYVLNGNSVIFIMSNVKVYVDIYRVVVLVIDFFLELGFDVFLKIIDMYCI